MKGIIFFIFSMYIVQVFSADTITAHSNSTMSVSEMTKARLVGKTYRSQYGDSDLIMKFKENGKVYGQNGPWTSSGTYEIKEDGTLCVNWDNSQWKDFCRLFSTFYVDYN